MERKVFSLGKFGKRLGTRLEGARAREEILSELASLPAGGQLLVDLSGLEVLSGSFADEAVAKVAEQLKDGELPDRYLLVKAEEEELLEDLSERLARRGLALLALVEDGWRILGRLPGYLEETLHWILEHGEATSPELAQALSISVKNASTRLAELQKLRLVELVRESRPMGGVQYRARAIVSSKSKG